MTVEGLSESIEGRTKFGVLQFYAGSMPVTPATIHPVAIHAIFSPVLINKTKLILSERDDMQAIEKTEPLKSPLPEKDRRKKVWTSEDQILAAIDKKKALMEKKRELAAEKTLEAKRLWIESEEPGTEDHKRCLRLAAQSCEAEAKVAERAYVRLQDKTIPRLGEALAAMRTLTMPDVIGRYKGVVI